MTKFKIPRRTLIEQKLDALFFILGLSTVDRPLVLVHVELELHLARLVEHVLAVVLERVLRDLDGVEVRRAIPLRRHGHTCMVLW